ncbi:HdeD family acid-resistance protein [Pandoraea pnomenusa]|uniref:HdeD family acid-resistance protein n=1 Tax=Pandoraea pnomenusa TaxID=93220 RepID=UPI001AC7B91B|nr:HdeD family acid-resistance protein [Pandoraea pnomenusa]MBN9093751.1 HdeD family acid-resistance protein [Pandoraea pnomenusa]
MLRLLSKYWWLLVLRGVLAVAFGVAAFALPGVTIAVLVLCFGAFSFVDGVFSLAGAWSARKEHADWWLPLLQGIAGIVIGVLTYLNPALTAVALLIYIVAWSFVTGVLQVAAGIALRREIQGELWVILSGVFSILFAIFIMWQPGAGALALIWAIGSWAIVWGALLVMAGFRLLGAAHGASRTPAGSLRS